MLETQIYITQFKNIKNWGGGVVSQLGGSLGGGVKISLNYTRVFDQFHVCINKINF